MTNIIRLVRFLDLPEVWYVLCIKSFVLIFFRNHMCVFNKHEHSHIYLSIFCWKSAQFIFNSLQVLYPHIYNIFTGVWISFPWIKFPDYLTVRNTEDLASYRWPCGRYLIAGVALCGVLEKCACATLPLSDVSCVRRLWYVGTTIACRYSALLTTATHAINISLKAHLFMPYTPGSSSTPVTFTLFSISYPFFCLSKGCSFVHFKSLDFVCKLFCTTFLRETRTGPKKLSSFCEHFFSIYVKSDICSTTWFTREIHGKHLWSSFKYNLHHSALHVYVRTASLVVNVNLRQMWARFGQVVPVKWRVGQVAVRLTRCDCHQLYISTPATIVWYFLRSAMQLHRTFRTPHHTFIPTVLLRLGRVSG